MNSKERVLNALNHEETDRAPFMYRDVPEVRARLKKELGVRTDDELYEKSEIDFRWIGSEYAGPTHNLQDDIPTENKLAMYDAAKEWSSKKRYSK